LQRAPGRYLRPGVAQGQFDAVVIHQVLHFLEDGARAIEEAARVLRPGGRLLVVDFAPTISNFCATSTPIAGSALRPRPWRSG